MFFRCRMGFWFGVCEAAFFYALVVVIALGEYAGTPPPDWTFTPQLVPGDDFRWTAILESPPQHFYSMRLFSLVLGAAIFTLPPVLIVNGLWNWFLEYLLNGQEEGFAFRALKYVLVIFALPIVLYLSPAVLEALGWRSPKHKGRESSWGQRIRAYAGLVLGLAVLVWIAVGVRSLPARVCFGAWCVCYGSMALSSSILLRSIFRPPPPGKLNFSLASLLALVLVLGAWASAVTLILRG